MKQKMKFLQQTWQGNLGKMLVIIVLSAINARLMVLVPMFIQYALDGVILGKIEIIPEWIQIFFIQDTLISKIIVLAICLIAVNFAIFLVMYTRDKLNTKINLRINRNIKQLVLDHIPKLEYMAFTQMEQADVIQRVNNDSGTYAEFFHSQMNLLLDTIFVVSFALVQTMQLNIVIGGFILILCFTIVGLSIWFFKTAQPLTKDIVEDQKQVIEKTSNSVLYAKLQKSVNRQEIELREFDQLNEDYEKKEIKLAKKKVIYRITTHTLRNFKEPFILLWGGILVVQGQMSLATISLLLTFATKITSYLYEAVSKLENFNEFLIAYHKLSELMDISEEQERKGTWQTDQNDIHLEKVNLFIEGKHIFKDINLNIPEGKNIAIVGDNGVGKTIFGKMLLGFYPYTGKIEIGKQDIQTVSQQELRKRIGIVMQEPYLFQGTIEENIKITNPQITKEEIEQVCKAAELQEDIEKMDKKEKTPIEKGGNNLSGGQKQRIAIARAIVAENQQIILDDSLSKLDTKTKKKILANLLAIQKGILIMTHDSSIVKQCDQVMFIHNGKVKLDTHQNLIHQDKHYREQMEIKENIVLEEEEN